MSETDPCRASGVLLAQTAKTALVRIHTGHWTTDGPASEESEGQCPRDRPIREGLVVHHERVYRGEGLTVRSSEPLSSAAAISTSECANPTQNAGLKQHAIGSRGRRHAQSRAHTALLYSRGSNGLLRMHTLRSAAFDLPRRQYKHERQRSTVLASGLPRQCRLEQGPVADGSVCHPL